MPEDGYWFKMPEWLAQRTELSGAAKMVWARLDDYSRIDGTNTARAGLRRLALDLGSNYSVIRRAVSELITADLLAVEVGRGKSTNLYRTKRSEPPANHYAASSEPPAAHRGSVVIQNGPVVSQIGPRSEPLAARTKTITKTNDQDQGPRPVVGVTDTDKEESPEEPFEGSIPRGCELLENGMSGLQDENRELLRELGVAKIDEVTTLDGVTPDLIRHVVQRYGDDDPGILVNQLRRLAKKNGVYRSRQRAVAKQNEATRVYYAGMQWMAAIHKRRIAAANAIIEENGGADGEKVKAVYVGLPKMLSGKPYPFHCCQQAIANVLNPGEINRRLHAEDGGGDVNPPQPTPVEAAQERLW